MRRPVAEAGVDGGRPGDDLRCEPPHLFPSDPPAAGYAPGETAPARIVNVASYVTSRPRSISITSRASAATTVGKLTAGRSWPTSRSPMSRATVGGYRGHGELRCIRAGSLRVSGEDTVARPALATGGAHQGHRSKEGVRTTLYLATVRGKWKASLVSISIMGGPPDPLPPLMMKRPPSGCGRSAWS